MFATKKDKDGHGKGLDSVENILKKYDGIMDIDYENNIFEVSVLMYSSTLA
ncbi:MAG: GHKL domain-containing protein [Bacillota bacterium]|nr:GHKL domain-containing protein [Bacillota bacterium]